MFIDKLIFPRGVVKTRARRVFPVEEQRYAVLIELCLKKESNEAQVVRDFEFPVVS